MSLHNIWSLKLGPMLLGCGPSRDLYSSFVVGFHISRHNYCRNILEQYICIPDFNLVLWWWCMDQIPLVVSLLFSLVQTYIYHWFLEFSWRLGSTWFALYIMVRFHMISWESSTHSCNPFITNIQWVIFILFPSLWCTDVSATFPLILQMGNRIT